jgi:hypothetical protein
MKDTRLIVGLDYGTTYSGKMLLRSFLSSAKPRRRIVLRILCEQYQRGEEHPTDTELALASHEGRD